MKYIARSKAFTLVELLVVIAIIGVLMGMLFPAVQAVREAGRRTHCANNLRQLGVALHSFESASQTFPMGAQFSTGHSWISKVLPHLEQTNIYSAINFDVSWDDVANKDPVSLNLPFVNCPTSDIKQYAGFTDYCGVSGSSLGAGQKMEINNGVLFAPADAYERPIRTPDVLDGLSHTICVAEAVAVTEVNFGYWACGWHCFTHDDGGINNLNGGYNEIASLHPGGAQVVFLDGSTHFLNAQISTDTLGALCTRNGRESVGEF